jgi:hypothetical protein
LLHTFTDVELISSAGPSFFVYYNNLRSLRHVPGVPQTHLAVPRTVRKAALTPMSDTYNTNQPWGQQQSSYGQPRLQPEQDLKFSLPGSSSDMQHQQHIAFPYNATQQFQPPRSDAQSSSVAQSTFPSNQRRSEVRATSFGSNSAAPVKQTSQASFMYGSNPNQHQTSDAFSPRYANPQDLSWSSNFENNIALPSNSGYSLSNGVYSLPTNNLTISPAQMHESLPQLSQPNILPSSSRQPQGPTSDPRIKRPRETSNETKDDDHETDAKESTKAKS